MSDWDMWVPLLLSVLRLNRNSSAEIADHSFANSVIESASLKRQRTHVAASACQEPKQPLTDWQKKANLERQYNDMVSSINLLFMPAWGCVHLRCKWYLCLKSNTRPPASFRDALDTCRDKCYLCNKSYDKYMFPVVYNGAMEFLSSNCLKESLLEFSPFTFDNAESIPKTLLNNTDLRKREFGIQTVQRYSVQAFYLQLVASKILAFELTDKKQLKYVLAKEAAGNHCYKDLKYYWSGFQFKSARPGGKSVSYQFLVSQSQFTNYVG
jgi:hypothetical protein